MLIGGRGNRCNWGAGEGGRATPSPSPIISSDKAIEQSLRKGGTLTLLGGGVQDYFQRKAPLHGSQFWWYETRGKIHASNRKVKSLEGRKSGKVGPRASSIFGVLSSGEKRFVRGSKRGIREKMEGW